MSTLLRIAPAAGFRRSTGLLLQDGRVAVLRIGRDTWNTQRGWLAVYENTAAWETAMDLRTHHAGLQGPADAAAAQSPVTKVTLPAGKYFIGDPAYGMSETMYTNFFGLNGKNDHRQASFQAGSPTQYVFRKTKATGPLEGSDGLSYDLGHVGRIGIMSSALVDWRTYGQYQRDLPAQIYTFPNPVTARLNPAKERYSFSWKDVAGCWNELVLRRESDWERLKGTDYVDPEGDENR